MTALLVLDAAHRRPVFDLVVATLWSDGEIADREIAAAHGAQLALGLVHPSDEAALAIARGPARSWRALAAAPEPTRVLAYAAAVWTAQADGRVDASEASFLRDVRRTLCLDDAAVRFADGLARWSHATSRDHAHPSHRAFSLLLLEGARRLASIRARRMAA